MQWAQQPIENIDIASFAKLIESDPGLYARILQPANSPYYGSFSEIIGLRKAILQIGLEETINSVYLFFFQGALPKFPNMEGFSHKDYSAHSWACASANRMLGHPDHMVEALPGELYIAGLLHGIGKLILAIYRQDDFLACIRQAEEKNQHPQAIRQQQCQRKTSPSEKEI